MLSETTLKDAVQSNVAAALLEDIGSGDITADLIPANEEARAKIITRETAIVCGRRWVDAVFEQIDSSIQIDWQVEDGSIVQANQELAWLSGNARNLLTGERSALNFLQLLSGTASICNEYAQLVAHTNVKLLDTRKTIPGLRIAQKYAAKIGGCGNHRIGLFDAFLIKENHIAACGSVTSAVQTARLLKSDHLLEVEVETMAQLSEALDAGADRIMLDNFSPDEMLAAVSHVNGQVELEASGNINKSTLAKYAETGVDYISIGALTKHCRAIDLSMRLTA